MFCAKKQVPKARTRKQPENCTKQQPRALKANDRIVVCTQKGTGTRFLEPINSSCGSAFVQLTNGKVGYNVKDRLFIYTSTAQTGITGIVQFNTQTALKVLNCGENWSNTTNSYTVPETGIYQITAEVSFEITVAPSSAVLAIQSVGNLGDVSRTVLQRSGNSLYLATNTVFEFAAGDQISVRFQGSNPPLNFTLTTRTLHIVQL